MTRGNHSQALPPGPRYLPRPGPQVWLQPPPSATSPPPPPTPSSRPLFLTCRVCPCFSPFLPLHPLPPSCHRLSVPQFLPCLRILHPTLYPPSLNRRSPSNVILMEALRRRGPETSGGGGAASQGAGRSGRAGWAPEGEPHPAPSRNGTSASPPNQDGGPGAANVVSPAPAGSTPGSQRSPSARKHTPKPAAPWVGGSPLLGLHRLHLPPGTPEGDPCQLSPEGDVPGGQGAGEANTPTALPPTWKAPLQGALTSPRAGAAVWPP